MQSQYKKIIVAILTWEARLVLKKYKPRIVSVTGSVGKTSTKDAIFVVLSQFFHVRKSEKSFNSETGIPLSILGVPNGWTNPFVWAKNILTGLWLIIWPHQYPKWLVLEVGADKPNDIKSVAKWLAPYAVVITRFPDTPAHIEFFESREHIIEEKSSLAYAVSDDGILILNEDDERVRLLKEKAKAKVVTYGLNEEATLRARDVEIIYKKNKSEALLPKGLSYKLVTPEKTYTVSLPHILSKNHVYATLAALSVAYGVGADMGEAVVTLKKYQATPGRTSLIEGKNDTTIIDDSYNASPVAVEAALTLLSELKTAGKKIAVLGDMLELGKHTVSAHKEAGKLAVKFCDVLVTVGMRSKDTAEAAFTYGLPKEKIIHVSDAYQAIKVLEEKVGEGDIILVKGSQGVRLERVVKALMANPKEAPELLVRQEKEWLGKE